MTTTTTSSMHCAIFKFVILVLISAVTPWDLCTNDTLQCKYSSTIKACHCDEICGLIGDCCKDHDTKAWSASNINLTPSVTNNTRWSPEVLLYRGHLGCHDGLKVNSGYLTSTYLPHGNFIYVRTCPKTFQRTDLKLLCEDQNSTDIFLNWFVTSRSTKVTYRNIFCSRCWNDTNVFQWKVEFYCDSINDTNPNIPEGSPDSRDIKKGFKCKGPELSSAGRPGVDKPDRLPPGFNSGKDSPKMPGGKSRPPPGTGNTRPPGVPGRVPGVRGRRSAEEIHSSRKTNTGTKIPMTNTVIGLEDMGPPKFKYQRRSFTEFTSDHIRVRKKRTSSKSSSCIPHFVYPYCSNLRPCSDLDTISTCQSRWKGTTVEKICEEGHFGRMTLKRDGTSSSFRNIDCVVCNGINPERPHCGHNPDIVNQPPGVSGQDGSPPPLSMIFDPDAGRLVRETASSRESVPIPTCSATQVLDVFAYRCRDVSCQKGYELAERTCRKSKGSAAPAEACLWVRFRAGEFEVVNASSVLLITGHLVPLEDNAVKNLTNSSVLICDQELPRGWNDTKVIFNHSDGTVVMSILFQTISLICLLLQFIVYLLLPALRNTPGLTIMSLVVALFYAQFLLLVSGTAAGQRGGCVFIAVAIHYFFLASFCWMCCLAFDLALTFSSLHHGDGHLKIRKFVKMSLFAWLVPLVIVLLALIMDSGQGNTYPFNPGYGQGFCWITNRQALYLWFLSPIALLLTASIALYTITVYKICQATKAASMVRSEDKLNIFLYIKLALIMGLTWILAFIWIGTKSVVMEYLFIIFNSLQGAFIFVAFVCRRKVYRLLKRKLLTKKKVSSRSSRTTLTSQTISSIGARRSAAF